MGETISDGLVTTFFYGFAVNIVPVIFVVVSGDFFDFAVDDVLWTSDMREEYG